MSLNLTSRLPNTGTSIFTIMSRMAVEEGAINLSQGFPDFPVSPKLIDLIHQNMLAGHNQYAPMPGLPVLKNVIAEVVMKTYQRPTDGESEIIVTAGGTEALFSTIAALIHANDEVIMFDPSYDSYAPAVVLNGGIPVQINLNSSDFSIDWDVVRSKINFRTKMIMINTPHNPTGAVLKESDLKTLEEIVLKHGLIILSDEVYERLIYDQLVHQSVLRYPGLASQSVAVFSFGKTFHATGWKVGYTVAPESLTKEIRKAHQFITFSVNTPVQMALSEYMKDPDHYIHLGEFFQKKRDFFLEQIKGSSFKPLPCHGSYFQLLSYKGISNKSDTMMAEWMTREHKLASIPISAFYKDGSDHHLLRFCFAKSESTLQRAGEILRKF
ncbi:MAG: aminotransferase class I/II-fold pyridoxal phosphate-dependent enzyme [Cyclobacteriaceae bacterium]|nr:aminotransferase class I/II-fold pyridoxal phosphate-dependent enzyme [Cyclobacteriaceae bacterium]